MVVKTTTFLLAISILQLCSIKTLATLNNPFDIPSCKSRNQFPICYADYKAAYGLAAAAEFTKAIDATSRAIKLVVVAKDNCNSVIAFFNKFQYSRDLSSQALVPCIRTWTLATDLLDSVLRILKTGIVLSKMQAFAVQVGFDGAAKAQNQLKCTMGYSPRRWAIVDEANRALNNALKSQRL